MNQTLSGICIRAILCAGALSSLSAMAAPVTHGVSVGEVTTDSAIIWSRTDRDAVMHVAVNGPDADHEKTLPVTFKTDFTGKYPLRGLKPGSAYRYKVWFTDAETSGDKNAAGSVEGSFRTAPDSKSARAVRFAWSGDLAGQNVCRDAKEGFPIMQALAGIPLDFFVGLGDMIYADGLCKATGQYGNAQIEDGFQQASTASGYWAHWRYSREDSGFQKLLSRTPYYAVWDDHEIVNDAGPDSDIRDSAPYMAGMHLMPTALRAFLDYNPINPPKIIPLPLYRKQRWGKHLEVFLLDTRQSRDPNKDEDSPDDPKSMLGKRQLAWLKDGLTTSDATWKIIVSSVPLSIPTGHPPENGRDGWASGDGNTGFEQELLGLFRHLRDKRVRNIVFIAADVHFASAQRLRPFTDSPKFIVHEFVAGPLNAGLFPRDELDPTLNPERLLYYGPERQVETWREARPWMNYGFVDIDRRGRLRFAIYDVSGKPVRQLNLKPDR